MAEVLAGSWEVLAVRLRCLLAEPQVAWGTCWQSRKWLLRYLLADVPQVAAEVLAGRCAASGC